MMYPLVSELAADQIPVAVSLRVLKLARQPYYRWLQNPVSTAELEAAHRANALYQAHLNDPEFGYRLLRDEAENAGAPMAARTAWRLCHENQWHSAFGAKRGKNGTRPGPPVHDDHVRRDFSAEEPNRLWLTDITEHPTGEGKLYLCAIKDLYAGRIVGYSMAGRMQASLAVNALEQAVARRGGTDVVAGCIVHSDRGSQGGFNRSSQHPQNHWRYKRWPARTGRGRSVTCPRGHGGSGERIGPCGPRCARPAGRSPHGRSNASFGG